MKISRRQLLQSIPPSLLLSGLGLPFWPRTAQASTPPAITQPILVNIFLDGGPDLRHLFAPAYSSDTSSYGYAYWAHRASAHNLDSNPSSWGTCWSRDYHSVSSGGVTFGILKRAGWLKERWDAGEVAIISNVLSSENRDHHHSSIIYQTGLFTASKNGSATSGWGGRLANSASANVISVSQSVRQFCFGPHATNPESHSVDHVVAVRNSRNLGVYKSNELKANATSTHPRAVLDRALSSYFSAKTVSATSPYKIFATHESSLRSFGALVDTRLDGNPVSTAMSALYTEGATGALKDRGFGEQVRNLYDSLLCSDILSMRVASMTYGGWDTHQDQREKFGDNIEDILGTGKGLSTLHTDLASTLPSALDKLVYVIGGEFGRQLASNGGGGTDHGRGMAMIVIGKGIRGGLYGTMFPSSELANTENGYLRANSDILGLTRIEYVLGKICEGIASGAGLASFPTMNSVAVESTGLLDNLFI